MEGPNLETLPAKISGQLLGLLLQCDIDNCGTTILLQEVEEGWV